MVSLQAESTPWFHYNKELPSISEYIPPYSTTVCPSYECDTQFIYDSKGDPTIEYEIQRYLQNSFVFSYCNSPFRYEKKQSYTLFLPIDSTLLDECNVILGTIGKSFDDRVLQTETRTIRDNIIQNHMCSYQSLPEQLQGKTTRIETKGGYFIQTNGMILPDITIEYWIIFPRVSIFFITKEIIP
jgi:hypothetical protein